MMTLTIDDADLWTMRQTAHYNGGKEWFGYGHQCNEQPRLYRLDRYKRKDRSVTSEWSVDGEECADLAEAISRLNTSPTISEDEAIMLADLTEAFQPLGEVRKREPYTTLPDAVSILHFKLSRKGLVWADNGLIRRTELGTVLLAARQEQPA